MTAPPLSIVMPGGSGQVGTVLARAFHADGHRVTVLSRRPRPAPWAMAEWDGRTLGAWASTLDRADVLINLAGRSVNCRYTSENRAEILNSRVNSVHALTEAIASVARPPRVWLQAGTATIYAHRYDAANDEAHGRIGGGEPDAPASWRFSTDVAKAWEAAFTEAKCDGVRKVILRSAMIMSPDRGGVVDELLWLVRRGLGGHIGDGRQYMSWIHDADFVRAVYALIGNDQVAGVVNLAAPNPVPNAAFMRALREASGVRFGLPTPRWALEIGAFLLRTESELVLKSRRVVSSRLPQMGFEFLFAEWPAAARDLCRRYRA